MLWHAQETSLSDYIMAQQQGFKYMGTRQCRVEHIFGDVVETRSKSSTITVPEERSYALTALRWLHAAAICLQTTLPNGAPALVNTKFDTGSRSLHKWKREKINQINVRNWKLRDVPS